MRVEIVTLLASISLYNNVGQTGEFKIESNFVPLPVCHLAIRNLAECGVNSTYRICLD